MDRTSDSPPREDGLRVVRPSGLDAPGEHPPCDRCTAKCCRYLAIEIDRPRTAREFDHIRWYLLHRDVTVWVQDGSWHVEFRTTCDKLLPSGLCGIYETRPQLCRDYGYGETSRCDYWTQPSDFDLLFESAETFEAWLEADAARRARRRGAAKRRKAAAAGGGA